MAILLNTTSLAMKFYHQPTAYTDFLDVVNQIFTYFFLVECVLKLGAFRFKVGSGVQKIQLIMHLFQNYFKDPWNAFDFFIVVGSFVDLAMAKINVCTDIAPL